MAGTLRARPAKRKSMAQMPAIGVTDVEKDPGSARPVPARDTCRADYARRKAASTVFDNSIAIVIGPNPPGTGVIQPARCAAASYTTSPTSLPSAVRLIPTSNTAAPGLIHSPGTNPALPTAATTTSARDTSDPRSLVPV